MRQNPRSDCEEQSPLNNFFDEVFKLDLAEMPPDLRGPPINSERASVEQINELKNKLSYRRLSQNNQRKKSTRHRINSKKQDRLIQSMMDFGFE